MTEPCHPLHTCLKTISEGRGAFEVDAFGGPFAEQSSLYFPSEFISQIIKSRDEIEALCENSSREKVRVKEGSEWTWLICLLRATVPLFMA